VRSPPLHDELVERLRHFDGHSDTLGLFADAGFLSRAGVALADPFRDLGVGKVVGIEARGFVLATAVALELGAAFAAVRKSGPIHPGAKEELLAPPDWRGLETVLRLQRHVIEPGEGVLIVDDWAETGSKGLTSRRLVEACGGRYVGLSLLVDQLEPDVRAALEPVAAVALAEEVGA
jgi:adenine/guanine phosphoribosyltransferase-like PRPP-binding protein